MHELMERIHHEDVYLGFPKEQFPQDQQGWSGNDPLFRQLMDESRPKLVIEVGTWKGQSTINIASYAKEKGYDTHILAVDTWLGGLDNWLLNREELRFTHGYPGLYYTFLSNVLHAGVEDYITPFPATSVIAARWLMRNGIRGDMIYIDASHDELDVTMDLEYYYGLLRDPGSSVFFGHDYQEGWPGVVRAVDKFAAQKRRSIRAHYPFWILE